MLAQIGLNFIVNKEFITFVYQLFKKIIEMKKVLLFAAAGLVVFASCRKNRTCQCTDSDGYQWNQTIPLSTKSNAEATCNGYEDSYTPSCELVD